MTKVYFYDRVDALLWRQATASLRSEIGEPKSYVGDLHDSRLVRDRTVVGRYRQQRAVADRALPSYMISSASRQKNAVVEVQGIDRIYRVNADGRLAKESDPIGIQGFLDDYGFAGIRDKGIRRVQVIQKGGHDELLVVTLHWVGDVYDNTDSDKVIGETTREEALAFPLRFGKVWPGLIERADEARVLDAKLLAVGISQKGCPTYTLAIHSEYWDCSKFTKAQYTRTFTQE